MDKRIADICLLLPVDHYSEGLVSGFEGESVIDGFRKRIRKLTISGAAEAHRWGKDSFDLIICYLPGRPDMTTIKAIYSSLRTGGTAGFLIRSGLPARVLKNTLSDQDSFQNTVIEVYGITPSLEEVRLAVPLSNRACSAASLALYQPSRIRAKVMKYLAYFIARAGLHALWTPYKFIILQKGSAQSLDGLPTLIERQFGGPVKLALFTGTPGYLRKTTIQVMDLSASILGYCKVGDSAQSKFVLENEVKVLNHIRSLSLADVKAPDVLLFSQSKSGAFYLIQSTRKGHLSTGPFTPDVRHLKFLTELMKQTKSETSFPESACYREVKGRLSSVRIYTGDEEWHFMNEALNWASDHISAANVRLCLAHRDFTPWNTFITDRNLYVFDWEFARHQWIPLSDAFHFVLQKGILVDRKTPDALWNRLMSSTSREGRFINRCASLINASNETLLALFAFYLCDMLTLYLFHYGKDGIIPPDGERLIKTWLSLQKNIPKAR